MESENFEVEIGNLRAVSAVRGNLEMFKTHFEAELPTQCCTRKPHDLVELVSLAHTGTTHDDVKSFSSAHILKGLSSLDIILQSPI